jgi:hypothetical protein
VTSVLAASGTSSRPTWKTWQSSANHYFDHCEPQQHSCSCTCTCSRLSLFELNSYNRGILHHTNAWQRCVSVCCVEMFALKLLVCLLLTLAPVRAADDDTPSLTVCVCSCCYLGDCVPIPNATHSVSDCTACKPQNCVAKLQDFSRESRGRSACIVLANIETVACGENPKCKKSTNIKATCVDRGEFFQRASCIIWMTCVAGLLAIAIKRRVSRHLSRSG